MIKYQATVTAIGSLVSEFIDHGILVFFSQDAPPELADFSVLHDGNNLEADLVPGDVINIDSESYRVLAVGDVANKNFASLGHLVMKFNGKDEVEMPGDVCVEEKEIPQITVGTQLRIEDETG